MASVSFFARWVQAAAVFGAFGVLGGLWLQPTSATAEIRYVLDFDGTIVHDQGADAAWITPWYLVLITEKRNNTQESPLSPIKISAPHQDGSTISEIVNHPLQLAVSYDEFKLLRPLLGRGEGQLGQIDPRQAVVLNQDPQLLGRPALILPGYYRLDPVITYQEFRTGGDPKSPNLLLKNAVDAEGRESDSGGRKTWRGYGFSLLKAALANVDQNRTLNLSTARYHSAPHMRALLGYWIDRGYLPSVPSRGLTQITERQVLFLHSPEARRFGRNLEQRKVNVVQEVAEQMLVQPSGKHLERPPEPYLDANVSTHTLIVAEDDPTHAKNIADKLKELSKAFPFKYHIKFVFFHSGPESELRASGFKQRWTVYYNGFERRAFPEEIELWTKTQLSGASPDCAQILKRQDGGQE